jgi:hypothetical protein
MTDIYEVHNRRFIPQPTEADMDTFLKEQFKVDTDAAHDPTNPEHVTRELMKPFPPSSLYQRNNFTYVQYQQVIRRLIYATGNNFSTDVRDLRIEPWAASGKGHQQVIVLATVTLTIPALQSSRTQTGVQVATVGFGEDMWKGAVSDGIKKAAQQFGVAIDLAGKDGEDTAPAFYSTQSGAGAPGPVGEWTQDRPPARISEKRAQQAAPVSDADYMAGQGQAEPARTFRAPTAGTGGPASQAQKGRLWHMSGKDDTKVAAWAAEYGETLDTLTKGTASLLIDTKG